MAKVLIIGIDGLDPFLLTKWKSDLPAFNSMFSDISEIMIHSTIPPDSICAWTSIYTGENPAEHGLIENIDYLSTKKFKEPKDRVSIFKGKTFWDIASEKGKSVCIINPFIAYPAWKVNGIMISGPVFESGNISAYPQDILKKYNFPPLGGIVDFPSKDKLGNFLQHTKVNTEQLAEVSLKIYKDYNPDLFFVTFLTLDRVLHFLWRYTDEDDPYYPGDNPFKNSIKDFYILFDKIVAEFKMIIDENTILIVISDHGHRRRCTKCLNLNEFLRRKGYLKISGEGVKGQCKRLIEKLKIMTLSTLTKYELEDWIYRIAKFIPNRRALKKSTYLIDKNNSIITLSNLCGTNPYGGININIENSEKYERLREDIIKELLNINKLLGINVVKWVKKREEIYKGENILKLPDILFELYEEYGVGMDMFTSLITPNYTHRKISGGHKYEATFLKYDKTESKNNIKRISSIIEIKNYILKTIDV